MMPNFFDRNLIRVERIVVIGELLLDKVGLVGKVQTERDEKGQHQTIVTNDLIVVPVPRIRKLTDACSYCPWINGMPTAGFHVGLEFFHVFLHCN